MKIREGIEETSLEVIEWHYKGNELHLRCHKYLNRPACYEPFCAIISGTYKARFKSELSI